MYFFRACRLSLWLALAFAPLPAQVGYPGGQYPGYPGGNGGMGIPIPHGKKKAKTQDQNLKSTEGMLRQIAQDQVVLEPDDTRILNFKRTDTTKFLKEGVGIKPGELRPGDDVIIESSEDDEGFLTAVNVIWQKNGSAKDVARAAEAVEPSTVKPQAESERPRQHRGD